MTISAMKSTSIAEKAYPTVETAIAVLETTYSNPNVSIIYKETLASNKNYSQISILMSSILMSSKNTQHINPITQKGNEVSICLSCFHCVIEIHIQ